ncbi:CLE10p like [Actinidia chinensis var. chinensis]|uniref:CLE10p like n=1 Tax=Actinidia chinensis var. chinensis TaxID=1590841 RepID=A0A2R6PBQ1_ACTCC|nr:CLE10p like [Actinidia chinensis var. chinensis]
MKSSLSSTIPLIRRLQIFTIFLLLVVLPSSSAQVFPNPKSPETSFSHRLHRHILRSCNTIWYYDLPRIPHRPPLPPVLLPPPIDEIDPRYGVEKRLVPSGPNPLHN